MSGPAAAGGHASSPWRVGAALGGVVLAAVAIFSLGVMYGSQLADSAPPDPRVAVPPPAAVPALPAAAVAPPPIPAERLTFYDRLSGAAPPVPPAPQDSAARQPAARTAAPEPTPAPAPAPAAAIPPESAPVARPPADGGAAKVRRLATGGAFVVQLAAVADRAAAAETAARVKRQGLAASTSAVVAKGKTLYRVRVVGFPSLKAAGEAADILRAELGLDARAVRE